MTIPLTVISFSLAMVIAVVAAMVQFANVPVLQADRPVLYLGGPGHAACCVQLYRDFLRAAGIWALCWSPFPRRCIVFSINEGAYCAETMRAALESVPKGQMEAGYCVGMSYLQIMRPHRTAPGAARTALPVPVQ